MRSEDDGVETRRIAFFGGTFDPVHNGHISIARAICRTFELDEFVFVPAFRAPHKTDLRSSSPFHRFAMLTLATAGHTELRVSTIELDAPDRPYTVQTLSRLKRRFPEDELFFVIGADSWNQITSWKQWKDVVTAVNVIVVSRPGTLILFDHVTERVSRLIVDIRKESGGGKGSQVGPGTLAGSQVRIRPESYASTGKSGSSEDRPTEIFITDTALTDVSSTNLRRLAAAGSDQWKDSVPPDVRRYITKYGLYDPGQDLGN